MKRQAFFVALTLLCVTATAQRRPHQERQWDMGRLVYDDFRGRPTHSSEGSYAEFEMSFTMGYDTVEGIQIGYPCAKSRMIPHRSWMLPYYRNENRLRYHQLQFDLVEIERRQLQHSLNKNGGSYGEVLLENAHSHLMQALDSLRIVTSDGTDTAALSDYERQTAERLNSLPDEGRLHFSPDVFYEYSFGVGFRSFTGKLGDDFAPGFSFNMAIDALFHRHLLGFNLDIGLIKAYHNISSGTDYFYSAYPISDLQMQMEYGYRFVDNNHWSLTPVVCGGLHVIDQSDEDVIFSAGAVTFGAGLLLQHRISLTCSNPSWGAIERRDLDFYTKVVATHSTFTRISGAPSGWGIYLHLGVGIGWGRYLLK